MYFSLLHFYGFYSFLIAAISTLPVSLKSVTKNVPHLHLKKCKSKLLFKMSPILSIFHKTETALNIMHKLLCNIHDSNSCHIVRGLLGTQM